MSAFSAGTGGRRKAEVTRGTPRSHHRSWHSHPALRVTEESEGPCVRAAGEEAARFQCSRMIGHYVQSPSLWPEGVMSAVATVWLLPHGATFPAVFLHFLHRQCGLAVRYRAGQSSTLLSPLCHPLPCDNAPRALVHTFRTYCPRQTEPLHVWRCLGRQASHTCSRSRKAGKPQ
mgnify:CR=1 FL=1